MSMERIARLEPPTTTEKIKYRLWKGVKMQLAQILFTDKRACMWAEDEKNAFWRSIHRIYQFASNNEARIAWETSVCSNCKQVNCPADCIQAIAKRRMHVWDYTQHDDLSMYACRKCAKWLHKCTCRTPH